MMRRITLLLPLLLLVLVACSSETKESNNHVQKGQEFLEIGDKTYALEEFALAIKIMPRNAKAYYLTAVTKAEMNNGVSSEVKESLGTVLKIDSNFNDFIGNAHIADAWKDLGENEKAYGEYKVFVQKFIDSENSNVPYALQFMALYDADKQDFKSALGWLQQIDAKFPGYRYIDTVRKQIASLNYSIYSGEYKSRIKANPSDIEARFKLAELNYDNDLESQGFEEIEKILGIDSAYEPARYKYAQILVKRGEYEKATKAYQKLINLNPRNASYHFEVAELYKKLKQIDAAIESYEYCIALEKNKEAVFTLAYLYGKTGRNAEAISAYNEYIILNPMGGGNVDKAKKMIKRLGGA